MITLNMVCVRLNLWMRRRYLSVTIGSLILMMVTLVLDICLVFFRLDLIFWLDLLIEILEDNFLLPAILLSISVVTRTLVMASIVAEQYFPHNWLQSRLERKRRQRFANFIVRRLLLQLELASQRLPKCGMDLHLVDTMEQKIYERARMATYRAVELFRRDAKAVLENRSNHSSGEPRYFVLEEEEQVLRRNGYDRINLRVTDQVLSQLLSPLEKGSSPKKS